MVYVEGGSGTRATEFEINFPGKSAFFKHRQQFPVAAFAPFKVPVLFFPYLATELHYVPLPLSPILYIE